MTSQSCEPVLLSLPQLSNYFPAGGVGPGPLSETLNSSFSVISFFPGCLHPSSSPLYVPTSEWFSVLLRSCWLMQRLAPSLMSDSSGAFHHYPLASQPSHALLGHAPPPPTSSIQSDERGLQRSLQFNAKTSPHQKGDICLYVCSLENCQMCASITSYCFPCC